MLSIQAPYLLFLGDCQDILEAKTAIGLRDWCPERCLGVYALSENAPDLGLPRLKPKEAVLLGAKSMVIGVANHGGYLPTHWLNELASALDAGLDVVNGLHTRLHDFPALVERAVETGQRLIDLRHWRPPNLPFATGRARSGKRLLTVGTDCMVGKKYASLALTKSLKTRRVPVDFRATGQTGMLISGEGIALDALPADFVIGGVEWLTPAAADDHWDIVEGQGSLLLTTSLVTMGLVKGAQPDILVVCHDPHRTHAHGVGLPLPTLRDTLDMTLYFARRLNPKARHGGICLNSSRLDEAAWQNLKDEYTEIYGLPVCDPMREGADVIVEGLLDG